MVQIETINQAREAHVGACVGPIYSKRPEINAWLDYNFLLGVSGFHIYVTNLTENTSWKVCVIYRPGPLNSYIGMFENPLSLATFFAVLFVT